jgi:hypothetical protein
MYEIPVVGHEIRKADQYLGHQRQLGLEPLVDLGERGDDENIDDNDGNTHGRNHERRVAQGGLDLFAHEFLELKVFEQPQKHLLQPPGLLAHADHRRIKLRKHIRMARQRC